MSEVWQEGFLPREVLRVSANDHACGLDSSLRGDGGVPCRANAAFRAYVNESARGYGPHDHAQHAHGDRNMPYQSSLQPIPSH